MVIGASLGGIEAIRRILADLPADLPAALFVVVHTAPAAPGALPSIFDAAGPLRALPVVDGEPIERGRIYVAPPDHHLLIERECVLLRRGPRENRARPAIDPLFRSAAVHFGGRVIGVVLTGLLNDGASGLRAIKTCGGLAVVQEPADAIAPDMPRNALRHAAVDRRARLSEMGALLARLAAEPAGESLEAPDYIRREAAIARQEQITMEKQKKFGEPSAFTCPDCHGALWEIKEGALLRFRCHIGHSFTSRALLAAETDELEQALSSALRSHKERTELLRRMADEVEEAGHAGLAERYRGRAAEFEREAAVIRRVLKRSSLAELAAEPEAEDRSRAQLAGE